MTYKALNELIDHIVERTGLPRELVEDFELMTGDKDGWWYRVDAVDAVLLMGKTDAGAFVLITSDMAGGTMLKDTQNVSIYHAELRDVWIEEVLNHAGKMGLSGDAVRNKIIAVVNG